MTLLKQFIFGCFDDTLLLKLRLEETGQNQPDYGTFLLSIRREEARKTRRQVAARVKAQQVTVTNSEVDELKHEISNLKKEVATLKLQHNNKSTTESPSKTNYSTGTRRKKRFGFCFKCGMNNHAVWNCENKANPELVGRLFNEAKNE